MTHRTMAAALAVTATLLAGPAGAAAQGNSNATAAVSASFTIRPHCGKITRSSGSWKWDCNVNFHVGPKVKVRFTQTGAKVAVRACAYGHRPRGFMDLSITVSTEDMGVGRPLKLQHNCSLSGRKPVSTFNTVHGTKVSAVPILDYDGGSPAPVMTYTAA